VVCADAAALAALTAEPRPVKLDAASAMVSGTANTNDIEYLPSSYETHENAMRSAPIIEYDCISTNFQNTLVSRT
jgi:hypothetical protein